VRSKLLSLYSVKYNPFRADGPTEGLHLTPAVDSFLRRVELGITDDGFTMVTGDPGTGKTIVMRLRPLSYRWDGEWQRPWRRSGGCGWSPAAG
jgi:type II secretory pathway predicted ATPase ExeA